jgi:Fur family transcriptional regulator, stress-responsive regulator
MALRAPVGDTHHHVVCRRCGRAEDVGCAIGAEPSLAPVDGPSLAPIEELGFVVDAAEVVFWGLCPACRAADGTPRAAAPSATAT